MLCQEVTCLALELLGTIYWSMLKVHLSCVHVIGILRVVSIMNDYEKKGKIPTCKSSTVSYCVFSVMMYRGWWYMYRQVWGS
jgi:hypothetical protein